MYPLTANITLTKIEQPPLIFITTQTYRGGFLIDAANTSSPPPNPLLDREDGIKAADYLCNLQAQANPSMFPGTYKALIAGTDRYPGGLDWVLKPDTTYRNQAGDIIGATNSEAQLPVMLTNPINGGSAWTGNVWSGFNNNWQVSTDNCSNWSSGDSGNATIGNAIATLYFVTGSPGGYLFGGYAEDPNVSNCYGERLPIYCAQQ